MSDKIYATVDYDECIVGTIDQIKTWFIDNTGAYVIPRKWEAQKRIDLCSHQYDDDGARDIEETIYLVEATYMGEAS